jgi:hypothetical protein
MNPIQYAMARCAHALLEQQKQRPLDEEETVLLEATEPTLRRAEELEKPIKHGPDCCCTGCVQDRAVPSRQELARGPRP